MAGLDDWDDEIPGPSVGGSGAAGSASNVSSEALNGPAPLPRLRYSTVEEFVNAFFTEVMWFDTTATNRIWCPQWWRHPAAIVRLEALHRSFEHLRQDPGLGISIWLRDHADAHMTVLTDPQGPFKGCSVKKGHDTTRTRVIPTEPAPDGLFEDDD